MLESGKADIGAGPQADRHVDIVMNSKEAALLAGSIASHGDESAFLQLFDYYAPRVHSFLMKSGSISTEADEITQETMLTVWQKSHLFDPNKSSFSTWLFRIARNKRIDRLRRRGDADLDMNDPILFPDRPKPADEVMDTRYWELRMQQALQILPNEQQSLIRLSFFEGLSHSEIADRLTIPLGTVKSRIRLAFSKLRAEVEGEYLDPVG